MKKIFMLFCGLILSLQIANAQAVVIGSENFDKNTHTFTSTPGTAWQTSYNPYNLAVSGTKSIWSEVPFGAGDSVMLTSPVYDCTNYPYVSLRFSHICKVSPMDEVRVEFKLNNVGAQWQTLPVSTYKGAATNYGTTGFNASSYSVWNASDSLAMPSNTWWREERFDLSNEASYSGVQFRFVIKKGNTAGTQISHGWVIDDFELIASMYEIKPPVVEFITNMGDTVGFTGPYTIQAKVAARTAIPVEHPVFNYTMSHPVQGTRSDSILMTAVKGDSIWEVVIPQHIFGTTYTYYIYGHDSVGNYAVARDGFISVHIGGASTNDSIIWGNTNSGGADCSYPWTTYGNGFNWSRELYHSDMFGGSTENKSLSGIAYYTSYSSTIPHIRYDVQCWIKPCTDQSLVTGTYVDPISAGATKVFQGDLTGINAGWNKVTFDRPLSIPSGQNLMVWWIDSSSRNVCGQNTNTFYWQYNSTSYTGYDRNSTNYSSCSGSTASGGGSGASIATFYFGGSVMDSNSAGLENFMLYDSVVTSPTTYVSVPLALKNKGFADLHTATIKWTVNGVAQTPYSWTGVLPDDFMDTVTIGSYHPGVNKLDTILAWVEMPNGVIDTNTFDDTIRKVVYGTSDIVFTWLDVPTDTVYSTGPYLLKLHARTLSGANIDALNMVYTYPDTNNVPVTVTKVMNYKGHNVWEADIENIRFDNPVTYSVTKNDTLGNVVTTTGHYYIKFVGMGSMQDIYVGDTLSTYTEYEVPFYGYCDYGWSRYIIPGRYFGAIPTLIRNLAFKVNNSYLSGPVYNQSCYMKLVNPSDSIFDNYYDYEDPTLNGYTLVWSGSVYPQTGQWMDIQLTSPFMFTPGHNVMVYWINNDGSEDNDVEWMCEYSFGYDRAITVTDWGSFPNYAGWTTSYPVTRIHIMGAKADSNSVAIDEIVSPSPDGVTPGTYPINVLIRNKGLKNLTSCTISYSINNGVSASYAWTGNLSSDFTDTVTIGTYTAIAGQINNITAWVSMPNNAYDSTSYDDTISEDIVTCGGPLSGNYTLGKTAGVNDFITMAQFIKTAEKCGFDGMVTLSIDSGIYNESWDFTTFNGMMYDTDTLIITSTSGNADDVIFEVLRDAVTLNNNKNITISNITFDASVANNACGVRFTKPCDNIEINGCTFLLTPSSTNSNCSGIYYSGSSNADPMGNLRILNNTITGGGTGIYLYYTHPSYTEMATSPKYITIDGNTITNVAYYGIYSYYYNKYDRIANNVIETAINSNSQYGLYLYYYNRIDNGVINNKIRFNGTAYGYGIYDYYMNVANTGAQAPALIANNEIIKQSGTYFYGIYMYYSVMDVINNSVYSAGTGTCYNLYSSYAGTSYPITCKGNISYTATSGTGYPLYISSTTYAQYIDCDYNDYYSTGSYVGYVGSAISNLAGLRSVTGNDAHSINMNPQFTDIRYSLDFSNNNKMLMLMPNIANLTEDIAGNSRYNNTCIGAYTIIPSGFDLGAISVSVPAGSVALQALPVSMDITNLGATPISTATIAWSINGVSQTPYVWTPNTPLGALDGTTITLGNYTAPTAGNITLKAWFTNVNNGLDSVRTNDTIQNTIYICNGPLAGNYAVGGASADFNTMDEAMIVLQSCGMAGNVTFNIAAGTYGPLSISNFTPGGNYRLTIAGATGNATDVKFVTTSGNALTLSNDTGIVIKNITFDASGSTGTNAVQFLGQLTDIEINGCELLASPTATGTTSAVIRYANSSGATNTLTNVRIINNHLNGGYYGLYMYYIAGGSSNMSSRKCEVVIDNNIIENYYYYGIYSYYYSHYKSISHNTWRTRTGSQTTYNMYMYYYTAVDTMDGNKIEIRNTSTGYGMYFYYYFGYPSYSPQTPYVCNNEIRKLSGAGTTYGMYTYYYTQANFFNNTVALGGTGTCYGLYFYTTSSTYRSVFKNNIFHTMTSGTGYPLYISSSTYGTTTYVTLDYNSYSSTGSYVGYVGSAQTTLAGIKNITGQNTNSINVVPSFKDSTVNLDLANYMPFLSTNVGNVSRDITGQPRSTTTVMGAYSPELYNGNDINLEGIIGFPESADFCSANYSDIDFALMGNGLTATNYATNNLSLHLNITGAVSYDTTITITSGTMNVFDRDTIRVISNLNITPAGIYHVKAWISCSADTNYVNDTIAFDYIANKVALPIDEDFANGLPLSMRIADNNTANGWEAAYDSLNGVIPATGNAMISFDGSRGAMTRLYTRQLDFTGTSQPVLDFWYYHDTAATAGTSDYTDVRLTFDGGETFTTLFSVRKNNGNDMGWTQYTYALDSFVNYNCVILVFEAMRMSLPMFDGTQYIDRIKLTSNQDLAIGAIQTSELTACNYTGQELQVVLSSLTGQAIDFSKYPTSLVVAVTGATTANYNIPLTGGTVPGMDNDTIVIDNNFDFNPGTYNVKAWIGTPIDKVLTNDTLTETIVVNPNLNVNAQQVTGGNEATNCIGVGSQVNQMVTITNNGNMDMEDLELTMNIYDINGVLMTTYTDTIEGIIVSGDSVVKTFTDAYTVPAEEMYTVEVIVNPACNANLTFDKVITECVDLSDIEVISIIAPVDGVAQGSEAKVTVRVANNHPNEDAQGVVLHAIVANADGTEIANWTETMNDINAGEYIDYEFPQTFTVPAADNFIITAFVNNVDTKAANDTVVATINTDVAVNEADANGMSLSQNVPNPASSQAVVSYSIPEDGSVVFTILNVTGQVLHTQTVEALAGNNSIEFNTENLAAGVYFYTMDFQGQRLMKKMVIKK